MPANISSLLHLILTNVWQVIKNWWWLLLPFVLWKPLKFHYRFWIIDRWLKAQKWLSLEVKLPKDILKPMRAMENVFAAIHGGTYKPPDPWETWIDGEIQTSVHFEIVSINGESHFYTRSLYANKEVIESAIYSQYPEAEITEVEDYTKKVPQSIPNKEWDMFGSDYQTTKDDHYPIRTYTSFETEHETKEEKRVDPVAMVLEAFSQVREDQQFWIMISCDPIAEVHKPPLKKWMKEGERLRDKLAKRPEEKTEMKPIIQEAAEILVKGLEEKEERPKEVIPPEMKMTPGERDTVAAIERKMTKPLFKTNIRFIWLGKRETWYKNNWRLVMSFFNQYATYDHNALVPMGKTLSKVKKSLFLVPNLIRDRRSYLRRRKLFRNYVMRFGPFFPRGISDGIFYLNSEELASLYHFPSKAVALGPSLPRIGAKKAGTPSELPTEE